MRRIDNTNKFEKELKLQKIRGKNLSKLEHVVEALRLGNPLPVKHCPHMLSGDWAGYWELHIEPDWLLIYQIDEEAVYLVRTGTHSDLF